MSHMLSWITSKAMHVGSVCEQRLSSYCAAPLLVASICLALAYRTWKRACDEPATAPRKPVLHRSMSMAALHGGQVAMQRIIDSAAARTDAAELIDVAKRMRELLAQQPLRFSSLQREAAKLEMSGREEEAVKMLREAWVMAEQDGQPHEAYELQMLLVEMLIYKGDYEQALHCKCLEEKEIADARSPLYKAVIYTIYGELDQAEECYEEFRSIQSRFFNLDQTLALPDIQNFIQIVNNLKAEIDYARKTKNKSHVKITEDKN